jgi:N-acyl-phosphatidylethanolamine-hydrolysing phospholipase D
MRPAIGLAGAATWVVAAVGAGVGGTVETRSHHTKNGFRNLAPIERGGLTVTVPFLARRLAGLFRDRSGAPPVVPNDGAFLRENARHSKPTVTWIGHATVLVQMDHVTFLTDPIWSDTASPLSMLGPRRFAPPALGIDALPPLDFVLISHNHYDHLDLPTLRKLAARGTEFFVPLRVGDLLRAQGIGAVHELDWWETRPTKGVEVSCVPSQHWSGRGLTDQRATLWSGWVVSGPTRRFYFAGDTGYFPGLKEIGRRLGPFGLAALPIGAYEPKAMMKDVHLDPEEALQAGLDVGAEHMLGMHYGTFDLTDEPLDDPPRRFRAAAALRGLSDEQVWLPPLGETRPW